MDAMTRGNAKQLSFLTGIDRRRSLIYVAFHMHFGKIGGSIDPQGEMIIRYAFEINNSLHRLLGVRNPKRELQRFRQEFAESEKQFMKTDQGVAPASWTHVGIATSASVHQRAATEARPTVDIRHRRLIWTKKQLTGPKIYTKNFVR